MSSKKQTVVGNYDSVGEFVAYVTDPSRKPRRGLTVNSRDENKDFFWTKTFDEAVALHRTGWPEGTAQVNEYRDALSAWIAAAVSAKSKRFSWDVVGDFIDVGRYMTGEPEVCGSETPDGDTLQGRIVSIRLNASVSGAVSASTIAARGVTVLVAVDLLEALGIQCEVIVACGGKGLSYGGNDPAVDQADFNVTVKRAGEQVDPDRLAFAVAHPSFFRRFGFAWEELAGLSPSATMPVKLSDYNSREGVIEIDHLLTGTSLDSDEIKSQVLKIARQCGVEFTDEQAEAIAEATT
jgi:hypothetical protein